MRSQTCRLACLIAWSGQATGLSINLGQYGGKLQQPILGPQPGTGLTFQQTKRDVFTSCETFSNSA